MKLERLSKEEIIRAIQGSHKQGEEYPKLTSIQSRLAEEVEGVAQAQMEADQKVLDARGQEMFNEMLLLVGYATTARWQMVKAKLQLLKKEWGVE